jgi:hypothetical protein
MQDDFNHVGGDDLPKRSSKPRPKYLAPPGIGRFEVAPVAPLVGVFEPLDPTPPSSSFDAPGASESPPVDQLFKGARAPTLRTSHNWKIHTVAELIRFRSEINQELPPLELGKMNLEEEMLLQYHAMRELQGKVMEDDDVPVNQRAQVANTMATTLKTIGDQQIALYSSERFKQIENLLIRTLDKLPEEVAAVFLEQYAKILEKHS